MDDPDTPVGTWVHWVAWNIPVQTREIPENVLPPGAVLGRNSWNRNSYGGPCPPSGTHRYFFKIYALHTPLELSSSATKTDLERVMEGHILARGELMGTYRRR
jgi:Raf kinase inhibitor-like YbhB/YbcL family protein